ncbi:MarR family transcriptional regulator [Marmoricola endophyticus]|uniref:MarR family transcriptional regulator n=1 Tax=Marmoricola endophyticus TaxID=2040280 RepID=A0A917BHG7_9ACTN|nr:MarR family transcriptional regulator [Marmoricola endophyticus]GGF45832.1 MarR family transcriptional regulator [Marmoricola endophyticus]
MTQHSEPGHVRLDDQLCFALYAATNAVTRVYRPLLADLGLTYPQYLVMLALWQDGEGTVGEIAARLQLDSHAVSPLVGRLVAAGLVDRVRGSDRRQVVVSLTEQGRDLEQEAVAVQTEVACASDLDAEERARMREELLALADRLSVPGLLAVK